QLHQLGGVLQLTAGSIDVAATRTANERRNSRSYEHALKRQHAVVRRRGEGNLRAGIERDQVYFGAQSANQVHHLAGVLNAIVDTVEQNILEGQALAIAERELAQRRHQLLDGP